MENLAHFGHFGKNHSGAMRGDRDDLEMTLWVDPELSLLFQWFSVTPCARNHIKTQTGCIFYAKNTPLPVFSHEFGTCMAQNLVKNHSGAMRGGRDDLEMMLWVDPELSLLFQWFSVTPCARNHIKHSQVASFMLKYSITCVFTRFWYMYGTKPW